ncbi:MAG: PD-(D/E)XK nuclease family protein, partial [Hyphomicrobiaceae bacterium]|nr:PD-(D/E)XK nuclease family protein [Hyphomicrobiaceae bacterium]
AKGLPVAGLDRFTLTDEIAVRDMMALFSVLLLPEDDLSLAALLKSPVFELDDAALEVLAAPRKATLFQALRHAAETDPALAAILADLDFWRARADFDRPYELAMRVLASGGRRGRFRQRLGSEVDDVLDAFLAFLLEIESEGAETLQAALARLEAGTGESKRDLDVAGDSVRIVTVHSAKGLEARVVFLCETMGKASKVNAASMLFPQASGEAAMPPFLIAGADAASKAVKDTMAFMVARDEEEYRRLLYVAMTRAEEQLIVTGHYNTQKPGPGHWYGLVRDALEADGRLEAREGFDEPVLVFDRDGTPPPGGKTGSEPHAAAPTLPVPAIIRSALGPAPAAPPVPLRLAASGTESEEGEAKGGRAALEALQTPERALALKRGTLAHHLFQHLPAIAPVERRARALAFLAREGLAADAASALQAEVEAVMAAPEAALLFSGAARAEVAVAGTLLARDGTQRPVLGRIDRLVIEPDRVVIADFKTASSPPAPDALPVSILRQMALYRALLKPRFTDRTIEAAILWTAGPRLDWIAPQTLDVALEQLLHTNCGE